MAEFESLKKKLCSNNCTVEDLLQFEKLLKKYLSKPSVTNDLPKLLTGVFKYSLHEDVKFRNASISSLKTLVDILDMNKHLKSKPWWTDMKGDIKRRVDILAKLLRNGDESGTVVWCEIVKMLGTDLLKAEIDLLNRLLKMAEFTFKATNVDFRRKGFECWKTLIDNFAINRQELNNKKRLNLLVIPLKARNHTTGALCTAKFETWMHLLTKITQHNEMTVELVLSNFLEFMFVTMGSIPPVCRILNLECAAVFLKLLKTANLFQIGQLPGLMIEHSLTCIEQIHKKDPSLSVKIWESLLGNISNAQWSDLHVTQLMNCLRKAGQNEALAKSQVFAEMIHRLYSAPHPMLAGVLMKHCDTLLPLMLEPHTLINFTEAWCKELFEMLSKSDLILLPGNVLSDIIHKLPALSASDMFREEKLKLLRGIWMEITHIFCKFISDNAQMGKNIDMKNEINNANILLSFGAAELSSMWNKLQMKSWKILYSESVKFCSLMPEADKFVSDLIDSLVKGVRLSKIPLHVAVDLASIILELHLSKDTASILPLLSEITEKGLTALQSDNNGTSAVLHQFLNTIFTAAKNETALLNDVLLVIDKIVEDLPYSEKLRSKALKAQHQLQSLKPGRMLDKSLSPGSATVPQASSPTMTSFLHRLAKAKESKSKMVSPTSSQSSDKSSSPLRTPNSKRTVSSFVDEKSEDFVFVPPKTRKTILTDHQKEALTARKHDIPALYQDLSQDSSQSALESIVTSVKKYGEGVDKVLQSPKKQNKTFGLDFAGVTPKKRSDSSVEESKPNDKESCQNQEIINTNSPICSLLDDAEQVNTKNQTIISPLKSNLQNKNESPSQKNFRETQKSNICSKLKSPTKGKDKSDQALKALVGRSPKAEIQTSGLSTLSSTTTVTLFGKVLNTIPTTISSNCNMDNNNENPKSVDVITLHSSDSESENDKAQQNLNNKNTPKANMKMKVKQTTPSLRKSVGKDTSQSKVNSSVKSPKNNTPKISPRRLRKRKSGVTPILGVESSKKKKLSLTRSTANFKTTPTSIPKDHLTSEEEKSDEVVPQRESPVRNCSTENAQASETPSDKLFIRNKTSPSELNKIKEDLKERKKTVVCSPVKVLLERVESCQATSELKHDTVLNDQNSNTSPRNIKLLGIIHKEVTNHKMMHQSNIDVTQAVELLSDNSITKTEKDIKIKNKTSMEDAKDLLENNKGNDKLQVIQQDNTLEQTPASPRKHTRTLRKSAENTTENLISPSKNNTPQSQLKETNFVEQQSPTDTDHSYVKTSDSIDTIVLRSMESNPRSSERITSGQQKKTSKCLSNQKDIEIKENEHVQSSNETKESSCIVIQSDSKKEKSSSMQEDQSKSTERADSVEKQETVSVPTNETPVKRGQKNFKQTQLPFTPVSKQSDSKSENKDCSLLTSTKKLDPKNLNLEDEKGDPAKVTPCLILEKIDFPSKASDREDHSIKPLSALKEKSIIVNTDNMRSTSVGANNCFVNLESQLSTTKQNCSTTSKSNKQDVQKTPEKISASQSSALKTMTQATEIPGSEESIAESPTNPTESEDIIASSQETVEGSTSISFRIMGNNSGPLSPPKLLSKSPKKTHSSSDSHSINTPGRVLRSSPLKIDSPRLSSTPIKKSVCRRLDVEIEHDAIEEPKLIPSSPESTEELVKSKLEMLNEGTLCSKNKLEENPKPPDENECVPTTEDNEIDKDETKFANSNTSPTGQKGLRRPLVEFESSQIGSPKRFLGSLRLENAGSPKSPSSRTNQMMELAMQDKEKTISSPISSVQKRRIQPIRLGPLPRTQKNQSPSLAMVGPSEEWVRRTYSPTASPNSSILKRKVEAPLDSPDSSPPSSKKKRVSFLDPPVSESLLFSKADPGKGQIQRAESKTDNESEEVPTQGTVEIELSPEKFNSKVKVFSPLKECPHPITDILGRISSDQWLSELESSLERLGVTSIGHLCSLSEGTVQRLPFRTPNIETLRKILQNYYIEIGERIETNVQVNENTDKTVEDVADPPVSDLNDDIQALPQEECKEGTSMSVDNGSTSDMNVKPLAAQVKKQLEEHPDLIPALGNILNIRTIASILKCFSDKLYSHFDASS